MRCTPVYAILLTLALFAICTTPAVAASPFVGTWAITAMQPRQEVTLWLVQLREDEAGKLDGKLLGALSASKLEKVQADGMELQVLLRMNDLPYVVSVVAPKEQPTNTDAPLKLGGDNRRLLGS